MNGSPANPRSTSSSPWTTPPARSTRPSWSRRKAPRPPSARSSRCSAPRDCPAASIPTAPATTSTRLRPAPRRPAPQAVGPRSRARSVFEVQSQQPGNFSLHVQDRVRGVQLVLQASHLRLERAHLRIQRVAFGRFRAIAARFFAANSRSEPVRRALRQAVRCELYNPSRRSRRPTSPGCVQRSASSRIRSRYSAVNWRRFGLATTSGSGVGLARPALGASSLRSSTPRAGTETSFNVIESLRGHRFSPPPPYRNSKGCWCLSDVGRDFPTGSTATTEADNQCATKTGPTYLLATAMGWPVFVSATIRRRDTVGDPYSLRRARA